MGGLDKGLQPWRGQALTLWVLRALRPQVSLLGISANRNMQLYEQLLNQSCEDPQICGIGVHPDEPDLPRLSGPIAGIITGLRKCQTEWVQLASCDTPELPRDMVARLLSAAIESDSDVAVPSTQEVNSTGITERRLHWTCALLRKRVTPDLADSFMMNNRKVGQWIQSQRWVEVPFNSTSEFKNMNTLETLVERD
jgi:molybdenum cofactor guanylyltransferase